MAVFNNILAGSSGQAVGGGAYEIERSLRFNSDDTAYLDRTPASAGNRKTWTWAGWVKRSGLGSSQTIFAAVQDGNNGTVLNFTSSDQIQLFNYVGGAYSGRRLTTPVYRDASAWYHILLVWDSANSTIANRIRLYVNGLEVTVFDTAGDPNSSDSIVNSTNTHYIGADVGFNNQYSNQYLADIHFIDGQALDPTSFGEFDATTGVWNPIEYTGSFPGNSFYLNFADNSSTTSGSNVGIGKDVSGNGNYWNSNNISVTAGSDNDSLRDSPTNGDTANDTGLGGELAGNYCTLNPLEKTSSLSLLNGNLQTSLSTASHNGVRGTIGVSTGKWYWEYTQTANVDNGNITYLGISQQSDLLTQLYGAGSTVYIYQANDGSSRHNGTSNASYGDSWTSNDVIGIALDLSSATTTITFYKNGVSQGIAYSNLAAGTYFPSCGLFQNQSGAINFGQRPFAYTAPSGFKALCTTNLPEPDPSITPPSKVMDVALYTGNGTTQTITTGFSPDLIWLKDRGQARSHRLIDTVRGIQYQLLSDTTDGGNTYDATSYVSSVTATSSTGFTVDGTGTDAYNELNKTYVAWAWDAGTSTVTNTDGSITSQVRANPSAGFSIVTWTAPDPPGSITSVGHGLNAAPQFMIFKNRDLNNHWTVYHSSFTNLVRDYLKFSNESVFTRGADLWGTINSSVFSVDQAFLANANENCVAYCFAPVAGYSAFGSYTGNGLADGPFVYTGFRPRWIMVKNASTGGPNYDWFIWDTARSTYNTIQATLFANLSNSEAPSWITGIDSVSNGFKLRDASVAWNGSGDTFVYAAFAEHPFQYSRAR